MSRISLRNPRTLKKIAALALRTRNLRSTYHLITSRRRRVELQLHDWPNSILIRTGTSDADAVRETILSRFSLLEYEITLSNPPRVILDIGANIGILSLIYARRYPSAEIFAFEPMPENIDLLRHNVRSLPQVKVLPFGLGRDDTELSYYRSDDPTNWAGGSFFPTDSQKHLLMGRFQIRHPVAVLHELHIDHADLIKIDTEGAEYDILTSFPAELLGRTSAIVGELHGVRDTDVLDYLSQWFEVTRVSPHPRLSFFTARNKQLNS